MGKRNIYIIYPCQITSALERHVFSAFRSSVLEISNSLSCFMLLFQSFKSFVIVELILNSIYFLI